MVEHPSLAGIYVDKEGRVYTTRKHSGGSPGFPRLLSGTRDSQGYIVLSFSEGKRKHHRVVAETFIPNPDNLPCVNHIDFNKVNNHPANLEWCSHRYNSRHHRSRYPTTILDVHTDEVLIVPDFMQFVEDNNLSYGALRETEYRNFTHKHRWRVLGTAKSK